MSESAAAVVVVQFINDCPPNFLDLLDDELSDAVATMNDVILCRIGVQQDHLDLSAIQTVDETGRIGRGETVLQRVPAPRQDESRVSAGNRNRDAGRHEKSSSARGHDSVLPRMKVDTGIPVMGVGRQRETIVQSAQGDVNHAHKLGRRADWA